MKNELKLISLPKDMNKDKSKKIDKEKLEASKKKKLKALEEDKTIRK